MQSKKYDRILCIGDIHGCADTLKSLIEKIEPTPDDLIIQMGDMIDRGDKSFDVVKYLIELNQTYNCVFLKGNHEDMWINYLKNESRMDEINMFFVNGGKATLDSYCTNIIDDATGDTMKPGNGLNFNDLPQSHQDFYDNLKIFHEIDDFIFVHAGMNPSYPLDEQIEHDLMWIRNAFLYYPNTICEGKTIVHGHTPMEPDELKHYHETYTDRINLDSACVFGYELTCMNVRTRVAAKQKMIDERVG